MELLDTYHADHTLAGRTLRRGEPLQLGEYLLVVHLCLFNGRGEMLIQKRQAIKDRYPGCWDVSAGGFARSGEDARAAVLRESEEELGFAPMEARFLFTEPFGIVLDDFFLARSEWVAMAFRIQEEEISEVRWASREEVFRLLDAEQFVDYDRELLRRCFDAGEKT